MIRWDLGFRHSRVPRCREVIVYFRTAILARKKSSVDLERQGFTSFYRKPVCSIKSGSSDNRGGRADFEVSHAQFRLLGQET